MLVSLTEELRQLKARAEALQILGRRGTSDSLAEREAIAAYAALKNDLADRMKRLDRGAFEGSKRWYELAFETAIRNAHIAMKSPTNTSPKNPGWASSVVNLRFEIDYQLDKLERSPDE
ncbi:hypothetical protein [Acidovorax sp. Root217]|uniref:hypothetical protein n=1 Tax=Acidovorax sp. Root217 TaxID=1736492 RepID=UPI000AA3BEF4|nr:hypothetical protein [Acidovorax sp. Root217]